MHLLAITTSTPCASVAIGTNDAVCAEATLDRPRAHDEFLTSAIEFCAAQSGIALGSLAGIVIDQGPGMFTGLRVGLATAKGLAIALGIPMVPVTSLDVVAFGARHTRRRICAILDAGRGEVFSAMYDSAPGGVIRTTEYLVGKPEALVDDLIARHEDVLVIGSGALRYRDELAGVGRVEVGGRALAFPSAGVALTLGHKSFEREEFVSGREVTPMYLRHADVRINWGSRRTSPYRKTVGA